MKIISCTMFFDENMIFDIKYNSDKEWVDEIHITETNNNFRKNKKTYNFDYKYDNDIVKYHKFDSDRKFIKNNMFGKLRLSYLRLSHSFYKKIICHPQWYNEMIQRTQSLKYINPADDDIIILSDVDEIIDPIYKNELIEAAKKHGIITVKFYFTMFYFNLFSENWPGPSDYSYRTFLMTGKYFKEVLMKNKFSYDFLRKKGEHSLLSDEVYCYPKIVGFHHSWLGDEEFIMKKMNSYAHIKEHQFNSIEYIRNQISKGLSFFPNHILKINNEIKLLKYIEDNKEKYKDYFITI